MSTCLTTARSYAKAIFDLGLEQDQLTLWQEMLKMLALVATECEKHKLLRNPRITTWGKINLFAEVLEPAPAEVKNLIRLLEERKKLNLLPDILTSYQQLFLTYNNILEVKIVSAYELHADQKEQLLNVLRQRYRREILLRCETDNSLIGGAILYIADKVIDGSIHGMLQRLKQNLFLKSVYVKAK